MSASVAKLRQMGGALTAIMAGASAAASLTVSSEGWENVAYPDPANPALATACAGVTEAIKMGRTYSDKDCMGRTAEAMLKASFGIYGCLPADLPIPVRGAFVDMAYNVGVAKFCGSSVAAAARAGDLRTACIRINEKPDGSPQWIYARIAGAWVAMPGLVKRRAAERALCHSGLGVAA